MDYTQPIGFFLAKLWRFGPLYLFLPIAAQCLILDVPFTVEEPGGRALLAYDGKQVDGEPEYLVLLEECVGVLQDDFVELVRTMQALDMEFEENEAALETSPGGDTTEETLTKK